MLTGFLRQRTISEGQSHAGRRVRLMFNWRRWFGLGLDGVLGRKVQRVLSLGVLVSMAAAVVFGIGWGVSLMLSAAMWQACD